MSASAGPGRGHAARDRTAASRRSLCRTLTRRPHQPGTRNHTACPARFSSEVTGKQSTLKHRHWTERLEFWASRGDFSAAVLGQVGP